MLDERLRSDPQHRAVILSLWVVVAFGVLFRMVLLVLDRERMTAQERSLRDLAANLTSLQDSDQMVAASLAAGLDLVDSTRDGRVVLYEEQAEASWVALAARGLGGDQVIGAMLEGPPSLPLTEAADAGTLVSHELCDNLEGAVIPQLRGPKCFVVVAPVASRDRTRQCLVLTSKTLIRREQVAGIASLAGQLSLALQGSRPKSRSTSADPTSGSERSSRTALTSCSCLTRTGPSPS